MIKASRLLAAPPAPGSDEAPSEDLDLWAQLLKAAQGRTLTVGAAAPAPTAFLRAWAEVGPGQGQGGGAVQRRDPQVQPGQAGVAVSAVIRRAQPRDAVGLSALANRTFIETFVEDLAIPYPEADLGGFLAHANSLEAMERRIADPAIGVWVAEDGGKLVAYAIAGPADLDFPGVEAQHGMIYRLYLLRDRHGQGLGQRLMDEVLRGWGATYGPRPWLVVFSGNLRAQRFYARYGFEAVGEYDYPVGEWTDREFVMRRKA
ncbi:MAG: GNAT family N-acetyltransferase [Caulobacteraceae bacterium]